MTDDRPIETVRDLTKEYTPKRPSVEPQSDRFQTKTFVCKGCGLRSPIWRGRCRHCGEQK
jgi:ribosomal protein L40E